MSNTFNIRRLGLLVVKHWLENKRRYLIGATAYIGILLVIFVVTYKSNELQRVDDWIEFRGEVQFPVYIWCLLVGGIIYAGLMFTDYNRKESGIFNLLLPGSSLEKALVMLVFGVILFWLVFTAGFFLVDFLTWITFGKENGFKLFNPFSNIKYNGIGIFGILAAYTFLQTLFLLGSIYFRRFSFFKTAIIVTILFMSFLAFVLKADDVLPSGTNYDLLNIWNEDYQWGGEWENFTTIKHVTASLSSVETILVYSAGVLAFAGFWWVITLRIKEKEI